MMFGCLPGEGPKSLVSRHNRDMICEACRDRRHGACRGGTWCDCQHQPPADDAQPTEVREEEDGAEPGVNWLRQG